MLPEQVENLSCKLNSILEFLGPLMPVLNCHMVNFITDRLWEKLPTNFQSELFSLEKEEVYEMLWNRRNNEIKPKELPEVGRFLLKCWEMSLDSENFCGVVESLQSLQVKLQNLDTCHKNYSVTCWPHFMSPKKAHEVETFGGIVATAAKVSNASYVVDLGGGKGYLGTMLALYQNIKVLSVDSSQQNTSGAMKLSKKIEELHQRENKNTQVGGFSSHICKGATAYISPQTDLSHLIAENFPEETFSNFETPSVVSTPVEENLKSKHTLCLAGLHTCGSLAPSSLYLFCANKDAVSLCSVGCCYNLMSEAFDCDIGAEFAKEESQSLHDFPMSKFLQGKRAALGRNARMLAVQALDRIAFKKLVMPHSLFYRAVLQVRLRQVFGEKCGNFNVGRIGSKVKSLEEYLSKSQQKLKVDLQLSEDAVHKLVKAMNKFRKCMEIFYVVRLALAPIVEAVIMLDRLLYLCEQGAEHVFLAQLFDPIISPRSFGIIAIKS